ncbi:unnamed protein product, partial [Arctogadus glacialis]
RRNLFPPVKVAVKQTASSSCCWRDEEHQEVLTTDSTSESHTDIFSVGLNVLDSVRFQQLHEFKWSSWPMVELWWPSWTSGGASISVCVSAVLAA